MRLTVGPLPSAVYWRRRAVVLGAVLAVVFVVAYACTGESGAKNRDRAAKNGDASTAASGTPAPSLLSPTEPEPSYTPPIYPGTSPAGTSAPADGGSGTSTASPCGDSEIAVTPEAEATTIRQGVPTKLTIKIKNISNRTCIRDVGAQMQEMYIQQGATRHWSSDACENRGSDANVVTLAPNVERSYWLTWDGKSSSQGCTNQPWLAKGTYQLYGRLGTKISEPVTLTVTT